VFDARGSGESEGRPPFTHAQWVADVDADPAVDGRRALRDGRRLLWRLHRHGIRACAIPGVCSALILRDTSPDNAAPPGIDRRGAVVGARRPRPPTLVMRVKNGEVRSNEEFREYWRKALRIYNHDYDPAAVEARAAATALSLRDAQFRVRPEPAGLRRQGPARRHHLPDPGGGRAQRPDHTRLLLRRRSPPSSPGRGSRSSSARAIRRRWKSPSAFQQVVRGFLDTALAKARERSASRTRDRPARDSRSPGGWSRCHADDGHQLAEHRVGHARLARRGAMAGDAIARSRW
jgi:hypothetical protein